MSQPSPDYTRNYSFTDHSAQQPNVPQPGSHLDIEFNNIRSILNNTGSRLSEIQQDDGKINGDAFSTYTYNQIAQNVATALNLEADYATKVYVNSQGFATQSYVTSRGYITAAALSPYLQTSIAQSTFLTIATAASTYQPISAMSLYLPLTGGTMSGTLYASTIRNPLNENFIIDAYNDEAAGTHNLFKFNPFGGGLELPTGSAGIKFGDGTDQTTAFNFTGYDYEIHVSQVDGNDTTGDGSLLKPYASITQGLTAITSQRKTVIVHPGGYTENPSITQQYTVLTTIGQIGGNTVITGTVSTNKGCTISGLKMTNLVINAPTGTGNVNILNCDISATLSKSNNADYTLIRFCDIGVTSITSSGGTVAIFGGNPNFITVNHAGARVLVKNATTFSPILTLGNATFADTIILATTSTGNALTTSAGTIVTLANSQIVVPALNNVARVSLSGFYSILNCVYDKPNSTLASLSATGGSTNSIDYFQQINVDGITFADSTTQVTAALPVYPIVTNATIVNAKIRVIPNVPISLSANKKLSILSQEVDTFEYTNDGSNLLKSFDLTNLSIKKFVINNINKIDHITIDNCTNLKEIKIAHDGPSETMITNGININSNCNAVESLNLKSLKHLSSGALPISFTATSNLLTLSLTNLDISEVNSSWYNSSVKNLLKLTLDSLPLVHYDFITATNFPNLEYLRIGNTGDYGMPNFSLLPKLKTLIIRNWPIGNSVPQFALSLKNVDISDSQEFDIYAMGLWGCTNMVKIRFRGVSIPNTLEDFPFGNDLQVFDFFDCNLSVGNDLGTLEIALNNINALGTSGLVNQSLAPDDARQRFKYVDFRGVSNPTFTSTPASVTALRARHWIVRANGLP